MAQPGPDIQPKQESPSLPKRQIILTMSGVTLALFLGALDQTIIATAMPSIVADLQGFDSYTLVTTSYLVASTTVVPIVGRLTDMYGRKAFFITAIVIFLVGSVLSGLSQTMTQLIVFRAIQGIGGGMIIANSFIVIGDLFPPRSEANIGVHQCRLRPQSVIGPTLGGFVTDALSWHWVFYINIPVGIPVMILLLRFFPNVRPSGRRHHMDYAGMFTLVLSVVPLLLALSWGGVQYEWKSARVMGMLIWAGVMGTLFIVIETRAKEPIIPLSIFRNPVVSISLLVIFLTGFAMFGTIIFVPLFFQAVLGSSATSSGSFLTPMMLGIVAGAALSGQAVARLGGHYRYQGIMGLTVMAVGVYLMSGMSPDTGHGEAVAYTVIMGFGLGTTFPLYTIAVQNAVPHGVLGVATSSTQFFRSVGGTLGLAVLGSVMANRFSYELSSSVPQEVKDAMPVGQLASVAKNPQALINPDPGTNYWPSPTCS